MAPRRTLAERELVLQMHERGNSYSEISAVLGISRSTYHTIVQMFTMRGHLRDAPSQGSVETELQLKALELRKCALKSKDTGGVNIYRSCQR